MSVRSMASVGRDALRRWRWWHAPLGVALGTWTLVYMGAPLQPGAQLSKLLEPWLYNVLQFGLPLVVALLLADAAVAQGARPLRAYGLAAAAVVLGGVFVIGPALMPWLGSAPGWDFASDLWLATGVGVLVGLLVAGHALWRGTQRRLAEARETEAERRQRAQALQGARLATLQARVEPRLLFEALGRVADAAESDPARADALLADTIALLRALLPATSGAPDDAAAALTTLGRELALVRLQARVADEPALSPGRLACEVGPEAAAAPVAPLLVPLWLRSLAPRAPGWILRGEVASGLVQLRLQRDGAKLQPPESAEWAEAADLADLSLRLREAHGPEAALARDGDDFLMVWPLSAARAPTHPARPFEP